MLTWDHGDFVRLKRMFEKSSAGNRSSSRDIQRPGTCRSVKYPNRRAGYDFTFSVPKSVSVYLAVNEDKVLEQMITEALDETMATIEARIETKVRKGYQHDNRLCPNMVYGKFVHGETRPVDGIPDPHYHIHVYAMNATFDEVEKEWKALELGKHGGRSHFLRGPRTYANIATRCFRRRGYQRD
jgi:conjugative relaxase-like TrwC/TraI family protein